MATCSTRCEWTNFGNNGTKSAYDKCQIGNGTYTNTGCNVGEEGAADWCDHVFLANLCAFLATVAMIVVSVSACCVVCCGKGDDGGKDEDSG